MDRDDDGGSSSWARDGDAKGRQCLDRGRNMGAATLGRRRSAWSMPCRGSNRCSHVDRDGGGEVGKMERRYYMAPGRGHGATVLHGGGVAVRGEGTQTEANVLSRCPRTSSPDAGGAPARNGQQQERKDHRVRVEQPRTSLRRS
jgi:hypothetical protein